MITTEQLKKMVAQAVTEERQRTNLPNERHDQTDITLLPVRLNNDEQINDFAKQILAWAQQESMTQDILQGKVRFTNNTSKASTAASATTNNTCIEQATGVVTERWLKQQVTDGVTRIMVGKAVVITPSAQDLINHLNITVERL